MKPKLVYITGLVVNPIPDWRLTEGLIRSVLDLGAMPIAPHLIRSFYSPVPEFWVTGMQQLMLRCDALLSVQDLCRRSVLEDEEKPAKNYKIPILHSVYELKDWLELERLRELSC